MIGEVDVNCEISLVCGTWTVSTIQECFQYLYRLDISISDDFNTQGKEGGHDGVAAAALSPPST